MRAFQFAPSSVATDACPIVNVEVIEKGDWNGEKVVSGTQNLSNMEARVKQMYVQSPTDFFSCSARPP